jgi:putative intracellular protease/amidase
MKIVMVLTSHDQLGDTGRETEFWLEEFAAPYFVFRDAGVELTLMASAEPIGCARPALRRDRRNIVSRARLCRRGTP